MRVSEAQLFKRITRDHTLAQFRLQKASEPLMTGKKQATPSEDPVNAKRIQRISRELSQTGQYRRIVSDVMSYHSVVETTLGSMTGVISEMTDLTVLMASDTMGPTERANAAGQVAELMDALKSLANTKMGDRFIFAGRQQTTQAYDPTFSFQADEVGRKVLVADDYLIDGDISGTDALGGGTTGVTSVFQTAKNLVAALNANNTAGIQTALGDLRDGFDRIVSTRSRVGTILRDLDVIDSAHENAEFSDRIIETELTAADFGKAASDMAFAETILQSSIMTSRQLIQNLNFDSLR